MSQSNNTKYKMVDLFCGAGGLSLGFEFNGCESVLAVDHDKHAIETYNLNRDNPVGMVLDVKELNVPLEGIDLVIGGPPCQGFSMANRQRLINDPRNSLYKEFIRLVSLYQPQAVIMENVIGIKARKSEIIADYRSIGYHASCIELNAVNFGIPQNRKRAFFFASKSAEACERFRSLESFRNLNQFVLRDALKGLRPLSAKTVKNNTSLENENFGFLKDCYQGEMDKNYSDFINHGKNYPKYTYNHKSRYNNERDIEIFNRLPQGSDSTHASISEIMPYQNRSHIFKDKYFKLDETKPCKTITAHMSYDCNMYIHPTQARGLTPREAARVQTFPDRYVFTGAYTSWYKQIGNAVPPMLAYFIAREILTYNIFK